MAGLNESEVEFWRHMSRLEKLSWRKGAVDLEVVIGFGAMAIGAVLATAVGLDITGGGNNKDLSQICSRSANPLPASVRNGDTRRCWRGTTRNPERRRPTTARTAILRAKRPTAASDVMCLTTQGPKEGETTWGVPRETGLDEATARV
jgi:hypothetical protein